MAKKPCFPVLYHPAPDGGPGDPVAPEEWRQLRPYKGRVPEPPASEPGANHGQERDRPYGSQRARQFISTRTFQVSAKYASPPAPPGFQTPFEARSRLIDGSNEVEFNVSEMRPRHWHPSQIDFAYGEAKRILEYVGLDPNADGAWCWRQSQGTWWALSDADGNVRMDRDGDPPGAWWLPRRAGKPEAHGYAPEFMKELSYEFGALEWALRVIEFVDDLKGFEAQRRQEQREMGLLTSMPEWATLEAAIAKTGDCDLSSALYVFRSALTVGELPARLSGEFMMGLEAGELFGRYAILDALNASEAARFDAQSKKELRQALLGIAKSEIEKNPNTSAEAIAAELVAEAYPPPGRTDRARKLLDLGLAATKPRVAEMIREELKAAGLYNQKPKNIP